MMLNSLLIGLRGQAAMQAEIIAMRHQLTVFQRTQKPKRIMLNGIDRCLWVLLSRLWSCWRSAKKDLVELFSHYHRSRTHPALDKDAPEPRHVQSREVGCIVRFPEVGGLHHRYERVA